MMAPLALGTAQFGLRYGVANRSGQVSQAEVSGILQDAAAGGIDTVDTAIAYGSSEASLGVAGVSAFRVVSKLPPLPADTPDVVAWVRTHVVASLERLQIPQLDALLLHRCDDLTDARGAECRLALLQVKEAGMAKAVGVSIYAPDELDRLWDVWKPDVIQAPFNVLDRRLVHSGWLDRLNDCGVVVHVRSAFLQGLLLMEPKNRPAWFAPWRSLLDDWSAWCASEQVTPLQAALAFARSQPGIARVVVGVDSRQHLAQILQATGKTLAFPEALFCTDRELIEPSRWKLT